MSAWRMMVMGVVLACGGAPPGWAAEAAVGTPAPEFSLPSADGRTHTLGDFRGKFVVLEWFNNECPFVRKHYDSGNMQRLQETYTGKGVVWLSIASSAPGKQGSMTPEQAQQISRTRHARHTALLLDPAGAVGRRYGAKTTPHVFLVNPEGVLIYAGAIDDKPSTDPADIAGAKNYVAQALDEAMAGQPVSVPETPSYGCSVKY